MRFWTLIWLCLATSAFANERPNIVFILADDLGYGDLGCYGRSDISTKNLDQLARDGVRFTSHYANGPECSPTRTAFLTGRYQQWVGGLECAIGTGNVGRYDDAIRLRESHDLGLPTDEQTIVRLLKDAGYTTAISGKWHLGYEPKFAPHLHGFDHTFYCIGGGMDYFHYLDTVAGYNLFKDGRPIRRNGHFTDLLTDDAISFMESHVKKTTSENPSSQTNDRPFFLYVPYTVPHTPYQGPEDFTEDPIPLDSPLWKQGSAPPKVYISMIEHMDRRIGDLLETLDRLELSDNTVVIFAGDNGGTGSSRNAPFSGYKGSTKEGGIRVPAIVRWPHVIEPGQESDQASITFDFTASIARIAGVSPNPAKPFEGLDIINHVAKKQKNVRRTLFWRKPRGDTVWRGVRDGTLKFVSHQSGESRQEFLYDLATDLSESNDLKNSRRHEFERLRNLFSEWETKVRQNRRGRPN